MCEMDQNMCLVEIKKEPPESTCESCVYIEIENTTDDTSNAGIEIKQEVVDINWSLTSDSTHDTTLALCKVELDDKPLEIALDKECKNDVKNLHLKKKIVSIDVPLSMSATSKTDRNKLRQITWQSKKWIRLNQQINEVDQKKLPSIIKFEPTLVKGELEKIKIEYDSDESRSVQEVQEGLQIPKLAELTQNGYKSDLDKKNKQGIWDNRLEMGHPKNRKQSSAVCKQTKRPRSAKTSGKLNNQGKTTSVEQSYSLNRKLIFKCDNKTDAVKMGTHIGKKSFKCIICEYECAQKKNLVAHMMSHTGEKPFSCNVCSYKSRYKAHLVNHKRTHTGERPFPCSYCKYAFSRKQNLVNHLRIHTGEKPFSCNVCQYVCSQKHHLVSHMRTHTGERPFSCHICNYRSRCKTHLLDHIRCHTGEKTYSCNLCNFKCGLRQNLVQHKRTHTGEKPFSCHFCDFKCGRKQNLVTHMRTHTGEKPFSCNICDYKCARKQNLLDHVRTHTGEKPFSCTLCDNKFGRKETLVKHMRTHTGEKPFACDLCDYRCNQKRHLVNHMVSRHKV